MNFVVYHAVADADDQVAGCLDEVLGRVESGVHTLNIAEPDRIEDSHWFRTARATTQDLIRKLAQASAWAPAGTHPKSCQLLKPDEAPGARDAAMTPLTLLVENEFTDGPFIEATFLAYASANARQTWEAGARVTPRGWIFKNGGSKGELPKHVRTHPDGLFGPRLIAVADSDKTAPPSLDNSSAEFTRSEEQNKKIAEALASRGFRPAHILPLRDIENYLPDAFWDAWLQADPARAPRRPVVAALRALSPDQRDHIDMEGDDRLLKNADPGALFNGTAPNNPKPSPQHLAHLTGRNRNLKQEPKGAAGARPYAVTELLSFVQSGKIQAMDLDQRDRQGALRALVRSIEEEL